MGCEMSTVEMESIKNEEINNQLERDQKRQSKEMKVLILGPSNSGKSTFLHQFKLLRGSGYTCDERDSFKGTIFNNMVRSMCSIVDTMDALGLPFENHMEGHVRTIRLQPAQIERDTLLSDVNTALTALWEDRGVQACLERPQERQVNDSARYWSENIVRLAATGYVPTDQDIVQSHAETNGITETVFDSDQRTYRILDMGRQRSELTKWIPCFDNIAGIIFVVDISEYDQTTAVGGDGRMTEALELFDYICNSQRFADTDILLMLNKMDKFKEKLPMSPIENFFPDYKGGEDFTAATDYIHGLFRNLNRRQTKEVYTYYICATNTMHMRFVLAACTDVIIPYVPRPLW